MSEKNLWIMVGIPGSGKSSYARIHGDNPDSIIVSNDDIFYSLQENKDTKPPESIVFKEYCKQIQKYIDKGIPNIYCDGLQLTENMRYRLLHNLNTNGYKINLVVMNTPLSICLARNEKRTGQFYVEPMAIKNTANLFKHPKNDHITYDNIIDVHPEDIDKKELKKKKTNLWIMCGVPGSGKSYFAKNSLMIDDGWCYISRDDIRFSLVKEDEEYFSKENQVFDIFCQNIVEACNNSHYHNVIADATHLNESSRLKLLNNINLNNVDIFCVNMNTPKDICILRNANRTGRRKVPKDVIERMWISRTHPKKDNFKYMGILEVTGI